MLISYQRALQILAAQRSMFTTTSVPLLDASKRILAQDVSAPCDSPLFTNSAMDGYAFKYEDSLPEGRLSISATVHAGDKAGTTPAYQKGRCIKIMTGAALPPWVDTVVPVEKTVLQNNDMQILEAVAKGANVRHQGEDIRQGEHLLAKGTQLDAERILVLAQFGLATVPVLNQPKVTIFSSGDELAEPGSTLAAGEIYNSSKFFLQSAFRDQYGINPHFAGTLLDKPAEAVQAIEKQLFDSTPHLLITTGAVSAGDKDFIPGVARDLGFEALFHKVAVRPGKPVFLARKADCIWVGLPGNPISTAIGWQFFVRPLLHHWANYPFPKQQKASIVTDIAKPEGLTCFFRGTLNEGRVSVHQKQGSAQLLASISANAYIILSDAKSLITTGTIVDVQTI